MWRFVWPSWKPEKSHVLTHNKETPHKCTQCNYAYSEAGNLRGHMKIHSLQKPNQCKWCEHSLITKSDLSRHLLTHSALWNKSNGSYDIKEFGTLPLIFSTSKYFRWKFQPWPSFFPHANIPDTWKRGQLSLEQMKKMEKVKVKSHLRYLAACSIQKKRWDIWRIFFSDFRSIFSP